MSKHKSMDEMRREATLTPNQLRELKRLEGKASLSRREKRALQRLRRAGRASISRLSKKH